jgi:hypothetical protein
MKPFRRVVFMLFDGARWDVFQQMLQAGEILGIPLLDHVIVAGRAFVSLAARGLLVPPPFFALPAPRSRRPPARRRR